MKARFTVAETESGLTLAAVLRNHGAELGGELPWSRAKKLCERGAVQIDGQNALDPALRVRAAQVVEVNAARPAPVRLGEVATIVWEDAHLVIIDKPAGVSSVPYEKKELGTAMDLVRAAWKARGVRANNQGLFIVHRIDKETSGLLAFAKSKLAERELQALLRAHDVERSYLCVAHGAVTDRRIETQLVDDRGDGLRGSTKEPRKGKRAITHVRAVERFGTLATLCEVRLETGKTHQIRIHLAEFGHPLVGEKVYSKDFVNRGQTPLPSSRLLLHAATLGFKHPITGEDVRTTSKLPPEFEAELTRLRAR